MSRYWLRWLSVVIPAAMAALLVLTGCSAGSALQSLTIDPPEVTMMSRGENVQLKAIGKKTDGTLATADDMHLRWSYSDGSIATVDQSGLLRGVLPGGNSLREVGNLRNGCNDQRPRQAAKVHACSDAGKSPIGDRCGQSARCLSLLSGRSRTSYKHH